MSTPPQPPGGASSGPFPDDRTRDVRRPSLRDRLPESAARNPAQPTGASPPQGSAPPADETVRLAQPSSDTLSGQPTDKLSSPSPSPDRQQTLAFGTPDPGPPAGGTPGPAAPGRLPGHPAVVAPQPARESSGAAPAPPGRGGRSSGAPRYEAGPAPTGDRRWPWAVLALLPILVIVVAGVLLFLLLGGA